MTTLTVFTSRYGEGPGPSALRLCRGQCEGMGRYPVYAHEPDPDCNAGRSSARSPAQLTGYQAARVAEMPRESDGWYFIECETCAGSGVCSWWHTARRVPSWAVSGLAWFLQHTPHASVWEGSPVPYWRRWWLSIKIAWLHDLGVR